MKKLILFAIVFIVQLFLFIGIVDSKTSQKLVIIDAGHGGSDPGNAIKDSYVFEKDLTLCIATDFGYALKKEFPEYKVFFVRSKDQTLSLSQRLSKINTYLEISQNAIVISIHANSAENSETMGLETYYYNDDGKTNRVKKSSILARKIHYGIYKRIKRYTQDRKVRRANFFLLREVSIPSVLVEIGYLSNEKERAFLINPKYQKMVIKGLIEGVHSYFDEIEGKESEVAER